MYGRFLLEGWDLSQSVTDGKQNPIDLRVFVNEYLIKYWLIALEVKGVTYEGIRNIVISHMDHGAALLSVIYNNGLFKCVSLPAYPSPYAPLSSVKYCVHHPGRFRRLEAT